MTTLLTTPISVTQYAITLTVIDTIAQTVHARVELSDAGGAVRETISAVATFAETGVTNATTIGQITAGVVNYFKTKGVIN